MPETDTVVADVVWLAELPMRVRHLSPVVIVPLSVRRVLPPLNHYPPIGVADERTYPN